MIPAAEVSKPVDEMRVEKQEKQAIAEKGASPTHAPVKMQVAKEPTLVEPGVLTPAPSGASSKATAIPPDTQAPGALEQKLMADIAAAEAFKKEKEALENRLKADQEAKKKADLTAAEAVREAKRKRLEQEALSEKRAAEQTLADVKAAAEKALAEKEAVEKAMAELREAAEKAVRDKEEAERRTKELERIRLEAERKAEEDRIAAENAKPQLIIVFQSPDRKHTKQVIFTQRPLGVSCRMDSLPITVGQNPTGEAASAGVREGWILREVGSSPQDMRDFPKSQEEPYSMVQEVLQHLGALTRRLPTG